MERRLAAILAADAVGYSRLMEQDEAGTLREMQAVRLEVIDPKIAECKGRIFKATGDGVLAEFPSVVNAVSCAVGIQRSLVSRRDRIANELVVQLRIGINLGDVIIEGEDVFGDGVNLAARLEGIAPPDGVVISSTVKDHLGNRLDLQFTDMGEQVLKNIERPVRVYSIVGPTSKPSPVTADPGKPSIAVLPFNNMSGDPEQEYFADGITEDIITELARNRGLFVIARNSSFAFKGTAPNIGEVGRKLGVRYVVEGSVRKVGQRVRITAQLVEAATGNHVWAERYDRDLQDIFAVQDEVTRSITVAVPGHLESDIAKASRRKPTESLGAYDHYLRGIEIVNRWRNDDIHLAVAEFEAAVRLDPMFARAQASLGHMHLRTYWNTMDQDPLQHANRETEVAVRLDGADVRCLSIRGMCLLSNRDFDGALKVFERGLQLSPNDPELNIRMAYYLVCTGEPDRALERALVAISANPIFPPPSHQEAVGMAHMMARRYEEAAKAYASVASPSYYVHVWAAGCLARLGRFNEAGVQSRLALKLNPEWPKQEWIEEYKHQADRAHMNELFRLAIDALAQTNS